MFSNWMKFSLDAARLGYEVQTVMTLRMLKLARGGKAAETEARRMVAEKGVAFAEAAATLGLWRLDEEGRPPRALPRQPKQAAPLALTPSLPARGGSRDARFSHVETYAEA
jgi:hypothetical protein